jgi:hypothetical protein
VGDMTSFARMCGVISLVYGDVISLLLPAASKTQALHVVI